MNVASMVPFKLDATCVEKLVTVTSTSMWSDPLTAGSADTVSVPLVAWSTRDRSSDVTSALNQQAGGGGEEDRPCSSTQSVVCERAPVGKP